MPSIGSHRRAGRFQSLLILHSHPIINEQIRVLLQTDLRPGPFFVSSPVTATSILLRVS
jgi:hypothetical protein